MAAKGAKAAARQSDDAATIAAIAVIAYFLTTFVHHGLGHGGACLVFGGKLTMMTSVYAACTKFGVAIDVAGPLANLIAAVILLVALITLRMATAHTHLLFVVGMAFNTFWWTGYFMFSGILGGGDWVSLVAGFENVRAWRAGLVVLGFVLYCLAMWEVAMVLRRFTDEDAPKPLARTWRIAWISYLAAAIAACAVALTDPAGFDALLYRVAPLTLIGFLGMLAAPKLIHHSGHQMHTESPVTFSWHWIAFAVVVVIVFAVYIGPGIHLD